MTLAILTIVCVCLGWFGFNSLVKARTIEDTPTSKIRSASQGYVELEGFAKSFDGGQLIAPLTGTPCVWFSFTVEHYQSSGKSSSWRTIESVTSDSLFVLEDTTGQCHINPAKADVVVISKQSWRGHNRRPSSLGATTKGARLSSWDLGLNVNFGSGKYRYTERRLHEGQFLYAIGQFQTLHAPSSDQQTKTHMNALLNQWKQDQQQLLARFDSDGNGEIDVEEWQQARAAAAKQANNHVRENYDDSAVNTLGFSPLKRQPYILSTVDPRTLTGRYRWAAFTCLAGALGCGVYVAYSLLAR